MCYHTIPRFVTLRTPRNSILQTRFCRTADLTCKITTIFQSYCCRDALSPLRCLQQNRWETNLTLFPTSQLRDTSILHNCVTDVKLPNTELNKSAARYHIFPTNWHLSYSHSRYQQRTRLEITHVQVSDRNSQWQSPHHSVWLRIILITREFRSWLLPGQSVTTWSVSNWCPLTKIRYCCANWSNQFWLIHVIFFIDLFFPLKSYMSFQTSILKLRQSR